MSVKVLENLVPVLSGKREVTGTEHTFSWWHRRPTVRKEDSCHEGRCPATFSQCDSLVRCNTATPTMISPSAISFVEVSDSWKNHIPIIATSAVPIPDHTA